MAVIGREQVTGLVLAGGRGSRMGGVDKGLQLHDGVALARHALDRLAPQVSSVAVNANRHLDVYAGFGAPVWPDVFTGQPGPLAGVLTGCEHCPTPYLATVPCDAPRFPADLVERLARALEAPDAEVAAATSIENGVARLQPVFALLRLDAGLQADLRRAVEAGEYRVGRWMTSRRCVQVAFDDAGAFVNVNTRDDLLRLQPAG